MTENTAIPAEFDLDAWLLDAKRPERSVKIYRRADLQARLDELERRIGTAQRIQHDEPSLGESAESLEEEYIAVAQEMSDSALIITVQGLLGEELEEIANNAKKTKEKERVQQLRMIEKALVSPKLSFEQLQKLEQTIGSAQIGMVVQKVIQATNQAPVVTVPFSRKSSGQDAGQE